MKNAGHSSYVLSSLKGTFQDTDRKSQHISRSSDCVLVLWTCTQRSVFNKVQKFIRNQLTSHAIVGEPLTELIHHDEEDADGVIKQSLLQGEQTSALTSLHSFP